MGEDKQIVFERDELARALVRMAHEIGEQTGNAANLVLIGIRSRGVFVARRIARKIQEFSKQSPPVVSMDVSSYRDDRQKSGEANEAAAFDVQVEIDDKVLVLIDDVIFRGRTVRAAMEAVERLGKPRRILVAALVDRGSRELPIRADVVGKNIEAREDERVNVLLEECDGIDQVTVTRWQPRPSSRGS
ncbi:MAG TPA: bifunctional pyr operon transcriptional regulator/uracil phosphoribosyltransferase PyrR [Candidatus Binatia bacterium]|jgi:pyrimidine operon attenuation protein/uracil phosphoribosyltransferase